MFPYRRDSSFNGNAFKSNFEREKIDAVLTLLKSVTQFILGGWSYLILRSFEEKKGGSQE